MRYGIFSDVHSNQEALERVLSNLGKEGVDELLCAGDLLGYGADPGPCLALLREKVTHAVCGNHDEAAVGTMPLDWFNDAARAAVEWTRTQLSPTDREYIEGLPLLWKDDAVTLVHGSLHEPEQFHYIFDLAGAEISLKLQETPVAFIGHTHLPMIFVREGTRTVQSLRTQRIQIRSGQRLLVNVGSVGQPRDGDPRAAYCLYDTTTQSLEIRRIPYPVATTQAKIRQAGLPEFLAWRLGLGL